MRVRCAYAREHERSAARLRPQKAVFAGAYNRDFRGANRGEIVRSENYVEKFTHLECGKPTKIRFCKKGVAMPAATW